VGNFLTELLLASRRTVLYGVWVGPRAGLDVVAKRKIPTLPLSGIELRSFSQ
jgi:hypothetical protein